MTTEHFEKTEAWTKWVMRGTLTICSVLIWNEHDNFVNDMKDVKRSIDMLNIKMVRIEYELKLKPRDQ